MTRKLKAVQAEISALEQQQTTLEADYSALESELAQSPEPDTERFQAFPTMEAAMRVIGLRLGLLRENEAQLAREQLFLELERQTKAQHDYYTQVAAIDTQIADLQQQVTSLTKQKRAMEAENRVHANRRIQLLRDLSNACTADEKQRLNAIYKQHQVSGYF